MSSSSEEEEEEEEEEAEVPEEVRQQTTAPQLWRLRRRRICVKRSGGRLGERAETLFSLTSEPVILLVTLSELAVLPLYCF